MGPLSAVRELRSAKLGFKIEWGPSDENVLKVTEQDPGAGDEVDPGTVVTITIGLPEFLFGDVSVQPLPTVPPPSDTPTGSEPATQ